MLDFTVTRVMRSLRRPTKAPRANPTSEEESAIEPVLLAREKRRFLFMMKQREMNAIVGDLLYECKGCWMAMRIL